jgi:hypothetical protein
LAAVNSTASRWRQEAISSTEAIRDDPADRSHGHLQKALAPSIPTDMLFSKNNNMRREQAAFIAGFELLPVFLPYSRKAFVPRAHTLLLASRPKSNLVISFSIIFI